jgi:PKD domain
MHRRALALIVSLLALAAAAPAAQARWFSAEAIDGPGPIAAIGNVSMARDGGGAVAYVKQEGDNPAGYIARFISGAWQAPERVPGADGVSDIAVAAGDDGRLALAWISNGSVLASVADGKPGAPLAAPVLLSAGGGATNLDIQIGTEGGVFAVWSQGGAVRAAMLDGTTWTAIPAALNVDPAHIAGQGAGHPRVAVAADDTAVVTWGERDAAGVSHVFYRRLLGTTVSQFPQEASVPSYAGEAGGAADSPRIDVEYDRSFAWVVFREDVGGRSRTFARRLRGSTFDDALAIDAAQTSTGPALDMNPSGEGMTVTEGSGNTVLAAAFADKDFNPVTRLDASGSAAPQEPVVYFSDRGDGVAAYRGQAGDGNATTIGRLLPAGKPEAEVGISKADAGAVVAGTLRISGDRVGDAAVAMLQGAPGARALTVALEDIPPARPVISDRTVNPRTGGIRWNPGLDQLGPQSFRVRVDGRDVGTATTGRLRTTRVRDGRHIVTVTAIDHRGQTATSRSMPVYTDTKRPHARVSTSRSGKLLRVSVRASDPKGRGTGVRSYRVDWGDGHRSSSSHPNLRHRYSRSGRKRITVTVRDRAGNEAVKRTRA